MWIISKSKKKKWKRKHIHVQRYIIAKTNKTCCCLVTIPVYNSSIHTIFFFFFLLHFLFQHLCFIIKRWISGCVYMRCCISVLIGMPINVLYTFGKIPHVIQFYAIYVVPFFSSFLFFSFFSRIAFPNIREDKYCVS